MVVFGGVHYQKVFIILFFLLLIFGGFFPFILFNLLLEKVIESKSMQGIYPQRKNWEMSPFFGSHNCKRNYGGGRTELSLCMSSGILCANAEFD